VGVVFDFLDGEADAVMGNALVDLQPGREGGVDPERPVAAGGFDGSYCAEGFDDTGEHGAEIRKKWGENYILQKNIVLLPSVNILNMLIIDSKDCENIDKALKKYKKKFEKAKVLVQLRERQSYTKPSVKRRGEVLKAVYKQQVASGKFES
jgi:small subunit ribosomal protein S21